MTERYSLTRRNLRDTIIILSLGSALCFDAGSGTLFIAFCMLGLGCFIHCVSKGILIRNIVLCTEGIYRIVRHPYYLANFLIDWSFCLLSGSLLLLLLYPFLFFFAYGPTMRKEEQFLFAEHSDIFIESVLKTPQIFPDINSIRNIRTLFNGFSAERITLKEYSRTMKFIATGLLLGLIQRVKPDIIPRFQYVSFPPIKDIDELLVVLLLIMLYVSSGVILRLSNRDRYIRYESRSL
ncbi:MAG: isoprenylcysteine carboxylmethyltransferase family protein [Deltaproteobacteria bacterium]